MTETEITRRSMRRALRAAALRYDGFSYGEIGKAMGGITREAARQASLKGERILSRQYRALTECARLVARGIPT